MQKSDIPLPGIHTHGCQGHAGVLFFCFFPCQICLDWEQGGESKSVGGVLFRVASWRESKDQWSFIWCISSVMYRKNAGLNMEEYIAKMGGKEGDYGVDNILTANQKCGDLVLFSHKERNARKRNLRFSLADSFGLVSGLFVLFSEL